MDSQGPDRIFRALRAIVRLLARPAEHHPRHASSPEALRAVLPSAWDLTTSGSSTGSPRAEEAGSCDAGVSDEEEVAAAARRPARRATGSATACRSRAEGRRAGRPGARGGRRPPERSGAEGAPEVAVDRRAHPGGHGRVVGRGERLLAEHVAGHREADEGRRDETARGHASSVPRPAAAGRAAPGQHVLHLARDAASCMAARSTAARIAALSLVLPEREEPGDRLGAAEPRPPAAAEAGGRRSVASVSSILEANRRRTSRGRTPAAWATASKSTAA